jgi:glycosyltransferase involved in cell wall biosynthesis
VTPPISVLFVVKNEEDRLPAALDAVAWADEVVVVDTGSTDATREVARARGARVVEIPWEGWVVSRNRALAEVSHDWVLCLDADERVSPQLAEEIRRAVASPGDASGFILHRRSNYFGRPVRFGVWNPDLKLRLARRSRGFRIEGRRVHERFVVDGRKKRIQGTLFHDTYRSLPDAMSKVILYARLGAEDRFERGVRAGPIALFARPFLEFFRSYVLRLGFLDGSAGVGVAFLHAFTYAIRALFLIEMARTSRAPVAAAVPAVAPDAPRAVEETSS